MVRAPQCYPSYKGEEATGEGNRGEGTSCFQARLSSHIFAIFSQRREFRKKGVQRDPFLQKMLVIRFLKGNLFSRKKNSGSQPHSSSGGNFIVLFLLLINLNICLLSSEKPSSENGKLIFLRALPHFPHSPPPPRSKPHRRS